MSAFVLSIPTFSFLWVDFYAFFRFGMENSVHLVPLSYFFANAFRTFIYALSLSVLYSIISV